ncbi:hypothetical protein QFC24_000664 [Naganishia onofrii]|uniref:Uncharacterized protein n=1 Tax=Naganishia onofrii TaxID=1851511 RepID=A0ACC2XXQ3_9TREE|nr:hypothetical protein QFC24_000664 [Naganishia onofrii]
MKWIIRHARLGPYEAYEVTNVPTMARVAKWLVVSVKKDNVGTEINDGLNDESHFKAEWSLYQAGRDFCLGLSTRKRFEDMRRDAKTESPSLLPDKKIFTRYETGAGETSNALWQALKEFEFPSNMVEPQLGPKFLPQEAFKPKPGGRKRKSQPAEGFNGNSSRTGVRSGHQYNDGLSSLFSMVDTANLPPPLSYNPSFYWLGDPLPAQSLQQQQFNHDRPSSFWPPHDASLPVYPLPGGNRSSDIIAHDATGDQLSQVQSATSTAQEPAASTPISRNKPPRKRKYSGNPGASLACHRQSQYCAGRLQCKVK